MEQNIKKISEYKKEKETDAKIDPKIIEMTASVFKSNGEDIDIDVFIDDLLDFAEEKGYCFLAHYAHLEEEKEEE